jgi:hypothetical protein
LRCKGEPAAAGAVVAVEEAVGVEVVGYSAGESR